VNRGWSTLALVVVLGALGGYIYFVEREKPASGTTPTEKVFTVEADAIQEITVTAGGETTTLQKSDAGWQLTAPITAGADSTETTSLTTNLASLEQTRVVDENAADLAPYGLQTPKVTVSFKAGATSGEVAFGDTTPTQGDMYAVKPGTRRVFLVGAYLDTTFNKKTFALRDKRALVFDRDVIDRIDLMRGADRMRLVKADGTWRVEGEGAGRADGPSIDALLTRLATTSMARVVAEASADDKAYGLDAPGMRVTLAGGGKELTLAISTRSPESGGRPYARDLSRPVVFTLDTTMNDDLTKSFDEYRVKELFEARPYFIDHLRLARTRRGASHTWTFVKKGGASVDATWTIAVDDGAPTAIEKAKVDALLTALNGLRIAESVEPAKASALAAPVLTASVSYDEGKFERVRVGQVAGTYIGRRDGEGVIGSVLTSLVDGVDAALDAALAPAPAAPPAGTPPATQAPATAPPTPPTP
jgi:hypothetical protein